MPTPKFTTWPKLVIPATRRFAKTRVLSAGVIVLVFVLIRGVGPLCSAQDDSSHGSKLQESTRSVWEFGVRVTAQSDASKIVVSFPIPIDWPEQTVSIQNVDASPQVVKRTEKSLGTAKLMVVNIGPLAAGEQAHVLLTVAIDKRNITAPAFTDQFVLAKKNLSKLRVYLQSSPQIESGDRAIRKLAGELDVDSQSTAWQQVETIFKWVRENIEYRFEETNRSCLEALKEGKGDCGEMTSLFIALCRARGIPARAVWIPQHTYPEFYLEDDQGNGHWFPCQVAGPPEFGAMTEPAPILQKGDNFRIPGLPRARRYVQPTLVADGGPVQLESIMRRIDKPMDKSATLQDSAARRVETENSRVGTAHHSIPMRAVPVGDAHPTANSYVIEIEK
jgi:transglutaminase superfamily protein